MNKQRAEGVTPQLARIQAVAEIAERSLYRIAREAELTPRRDFDGLLRPAIPMRQETHRLLRAVAIRRAKKVPGEVPSIGAIIEELVERARPELEREAGALLKRELNKKK